MLNKNGSTGSYIYSVRVTPLHLNIIFNITKGDAISENTSRLNFFFIYGFESMLHNVK